MTECDVNKNFRDVVSEPNYFCHLYLGVRITPVNDCFHGEFSVYAPGVDKVSVVGDFNQWDKSKNPLTLDPYSGIWHGGCSNINIGDCYKFCIQKKSTTFLKADPYAEQSELRPNDASVIASPSPYPWRDREWMLKRKHASPALDKSSPLLILEVHLGSWKTFDDKFYSYRDLAHEIAEYASVMNYTHIELLPITEHLVDESMGYQVTGYFSPTARFGLRNDLKYFIDVCHSKNIGVILDWVPAHFSKDPSGLSNFTGEATYEYTDKKKAERVNWGTRVFDFSKRPVINFLISNALYWLNEFHFDGLRIDAVSSMLYLDFLRENDEWEPNHLGNNLNLEAIEFIKELVAACKESVPDAVLIAEEATAWPKTTEPISEGGLGFDYVWNLGWITDTRRYFSLSEREKLQQPRLITFSAIYMFNERYIHSFSHDELDCTTDGLNAFANSLSSEVHGKRDQAALFLFFLYVFPGAKLILAGADMGIMSPWDPCSTIDWCEARSPENRQFTLFVKKLNELNLRKNFTLSNHDENLFKWEDCLQKNLFCLVFMRYGKSEDYLILLNFSKDSISYDLGWSLNEFELILNTPYAQSPIDVRNKSLLNLSGYSGYVFMRTKT